MVPHTYQCGYVVLTVPHIYLRTLLFELGINSVADNYISPTPTHTQSSPQAHSHTTYPTLPPHALPGQWLPPSEGCCVPFSLCYPIKPLLTNVIESHSAPEQDPQKTRGIKYEHPVSWLAIPPKKVQMALGFCHAFHRCHISTPSTPFTTTTEGCHAPSLTPHNPPL